MELRAKASDGEALTHSEGLLGTLAYMPPERLKGWSDPLGDIYSLGLTLYELLTLERPFDDTDQHRVMKRIAEEEPRITIWYSNLKK